MFKRIFDRYVNLGILPKLLISYLVISVIPLIVVGYIANKNLSETGYQALRRAEEMGKENLKAAEALGRNSIADSVEALDLKSTEAIELRSVELALRIADFLHERDKDIQILASLAPSPQSYLDIYRASRRDVIATKENAGTKSSAAKTGVLRPRNHENKEAWRHRPPSDFHKVSKPLYREITYVDLQGRERIKIADEKISDNLADISRKENTYCRAEDYFTSLRHLKKGDIFVSRVIGTYVKGWLNKTPKGIRVKPESAYAGKENPDGRKFEGIIRWGKAVYNGNGKRTGYVTMALDHAHVMEFTDHIVPTEERFTVLSDGGSGNYAFIWDNEDRCISHARDFFICGFNPATGKEVPGWVSQATYDEFKKSGLTMEAFVARLPSFRNFSQKKAGSAEQIASGEIPLDCRVLDTAPQCQGWHEGTEDGGSGSFLILWSGLWKLTTYATIPYYTGPYGKSKKGFGYVTIGANVADFHKDANITKAKIENTILEEGLIILFENSKTKALISESATRNRNLITIISVIAGMAVIGVSLMISIRITDPLRRLTEGAVAMSKGNFDQSIEVKSKDEIGRLAESFNEMAKAVSEVDRMKSEFVTIASHELRTPIQAMMLGVSGILEGYSGKIDQEAREDLNMTMEGIQRLMRLISNLLDLSRIEAQKIDLNVAGTPVTEIVDRALAEVNDLAQVCGHTIVEHVPAGIPDIRVDKDRLIQVLINLLSNSIKYTPKGGTIIVQAERREAETVLTIADNGYGVPAWAREEIFKKFFQADSIMSQKVGGSGLGLTIAKGLVEKHGGSIHCESPVPEGAFPDLPLGGERKGAVFFIHLPVPDVIHFTNG